MLLPLKWLLGAFLAAFIHECCHLTAISLLGGSVHQITIGPSGTVIDLDPMSNGKELLCAAAGPAGSLLLLFFSKWFPELAICGLVQGAFNLLPVYPMDGGRVLRCILRFIVPTQADSLSIRTGIVISALLAICAIAWGIWPVFILFTAFIRICIRKIPCKEGKVAVQ